jgi:hypothetical protein
VAKVTRLQRRVASMIRNGASLDEVERKVIEPCDFGPDRQAALWLYAWSLVELREDHVRASSALTVR